MKPALVVASWALVLCQVWANPRFEGYMYTTPCNQLPEPCRTTTETQTVTEQSVCDDFTVYDTITSTLPPETRTDTLTITSHRTDTSYFTRTIPITETREVTDYRTETSTRIVPTTVVRTVTSTSVPSPVTKYFTETETRTRTATSTVIEPTTEYLTETETKYVTRDPETLTQFVPVVTTMTQPCTSLGYLPPPPPKQCSCPSQNCPPNQYLPPQSPNHYLPPPAKTHMSNVIPQRNRFHLIGAHPPPGVF